MRMFTISAGLALLLASSAFAQQEQKSFVGEGIFDWIDNGGEANPNRVELFVEEHGIIRTFDSFSLFGFSHTWAGDLIIKLTHKDTGTSVTMLDRPGVPESVFGDSADFLGDYDWEDGGFIYDADIYGAFVPTNVIMGPVSGLLSDFAGEDKFGVWSLTISDNAAGDLGSLQSWGFTVTNVPAPGVLALLGIAGLVGRRNRRRA